MAGQLIRPDDYSSIRRTLDLSLDEADLPDEVMNDPLYKGLVEAEVKRRVPGWGAILVAGGNDELYLRSAAKLLLAAAIAPRLPQIVSEEEASYRYRRTAFDWQAMAALLRGQADDAIAQIDPTYLLTTENTRRRPEFFGTAAGGRGRLSGGKLRGFGVGASNLDDTVP